MYAAQARGDRRRRLAPTCYACSEGQRCCGGVIPERRQLLRRWGAGSPGNPQAPLGSGSALPDSLAATPLPSVYLHVRHSRSCATLGWCLVPLGADSEALKRAPDVREACAKPTACTEPRCLLRSARPDRREEWRKKGVDSGNRRAHPPAYGVVAPVRRSTGAGAGAPWPPRHTRGAQPGLESARDRVWRGAFRAASRGAWPPIRPAREACAAKIWHGWLGPHKWVVRPISSRGRAPLWSHRRGAGAAEPPSSGVTSPGAACCRIHQRTAEHLEPGGEGWLGFGSCGPGPALGASVALRRGGLESRDRGHTSASSRVSDDTDPRHAARSEELTSLCGTSGEQVSVAVSGKRSSCSLLPAQCLKPSSCSLRARASPAIESPFTRPEYSTALRLSGTFRAGGRSRPAG